MDNSNQNQLTANIARDIVSQMAPQEIPLFRANSELYFKDPQKALKSQEGSDDMLGFGTGEAVAYLTPIILTVSFEVVKFVTEEVKKSLKTESTNAINEAVQRMFKKFRPIPVTGQAEDPAPTMLTVEQLREVHQRAFEKACQLRLSEAKARQLADSLVGELVSSPG